MRTSLIKLQYINDVELGRGGGGGGGECSPVRF